MLHRRATANSCIFIEHMFENVLGGVNLLKIERACMERLGATLNKQVPGQSDKEYYKANKTEIARKQKEYKQVKVTCECGSVVSKNNIATHRKSKKHQDFIATQTEE